MMTPLELLVSICEEIYDKYQEIDTLLEQLSRDDSIHEDVKEQFSELYRTFDDEKIDFILYVALQAKLKEKEED